MQLAGVALQMVACPCGTVSHILANTDTLPEHAVYPGITRKLSMAADRKFVRIDEDGESLQITKGPHVQAQIAKITHRMPKVTVPSFSLVERKQNP